MRMVCIGERGGGGVLDRPPLNWKNFVEKVVADKVRRY